MNTTTASLCPEHRALARDLWQALYNAPSQDAVVAARREFDAAPQEVKDAILTASVRGGLKSNGEPDSNPFD